MFCIYYIYEDVYPILYLLGCLFFVSNEAACYDVMAQVADFYQKQSFGKLTVQTTVTPPVRLPRTEAYYIAKDGEIDGLALEHSDAMSEARVLGYDSSADTSAGT